MPPLPPDVDARVMAAVAEVPDPFARAGLQVLRGTGLRVGELLDLELGAVMDYGPAGTWLRVPLGKLATERTCRSTSQPWPPSMSRPTGKAAIARSRTRAPAHRPTSCSPNTAAGWEPPGSATDSSRRWPRPGPTTPRVQPLTVTPHQLRHTYATALAQRQHVAATSPKDPAPYANICETRDNYTTAAEFQPALTDQRADIRALQADAAHRGWTGEEQRHRQVAEFLQTHLDSVRPR